LRRLEQSHLPRLAAAGVEFRPMEGPLPWQTRPGVKSDDIRDLATDIEEAGGLL